MSLSIRLQLYSILSSPSGSSQEAGLGTSFSVGTSSCSDGSPLSQPKTPCDLRCQESSLDRDQAGVYHLVFM